MHRYQRLSALLRGEAPRALLQAVPRGYVAARARALAEGPCVAAFRWAGGGAWGGKPWSVELPTDSALLLYLFAAFLEARRSACRCVAILNTCRDPAWLHSSCAGIIVFLIVVGVDAHPTY